MAVPSRPVARIPEHDAVQPEESPLRLRAHFGTSLTWTRFITAAPGWQLQVSSTVNVPGFAITALQRRPSPALVQ